MELQVVLVTRLGGRCRRQSETEITVDRSETEEIDAEENAAETGDAKARSVLQNDGDGLEDEGSVILDAGSEKRDS